MQRMLKRGNRFAELMEESRRQRELGQHEQAMKAAREAMRYEPSSLSARMMVGDCQIALGREEEGIEVFKEICQLDRTHLEARLALIEIYCQSEHFGDMTRMLREAIQLAPDREDLKALLDDALSRKGQTSKAQSERTRPSTSDSKSATVRHLDRGRAFENAGQMTAALREYERAYEREPENPEVVLAVGRAYLRHGLKATADRQFAVAMYQFPNSFELHLGIADVYVNGTDYEKALLVAKRAAELRPEEFRAHYLLGLALLRSGRVGEAIPPLEEAARLNPESLEVQTALAEASTGSGAIGE